MDRWDDRVDSFMIKLLDRAGRKMGDEYRCKDYGEYEKLKGGCEGGLEV